MADIKALKDAVWLKKEEIKKEEEPLASWTEQLQMVRGIMETDGRSQEYEDMEQEIIRSMALHETSLARLRPQLQKLEAQLPQTAQPAAPKFDPEKHPLLRKVAEKQEPEKPVTFAPGDPVEAQWTDRSWYKAKVMSVLGSASAPRYIVRFVEYDEKITVDSNAVRPPPSKKKYNMEPAAAPSPALPVTSTPHVISGPASINPGAQAAKKNAVEDDELKPKSRIPNNGQLKKRKSTWQDFQAKTSKKIPKKESMFRTSTEAGSRVGFTGSGKGMTETHKRTRYDHKADAENDEEYKKEAAPQARKCYDIKSEPDRGNERKRGAPPQARLRY
ncbi:hypothetical protein CC86DRAFT_367382 [Ophiobolus disseminans]|uniref:Tudor domain-containing protein n=1 Tax=Ophiobolus disseminans TaxID=1469910 RepID=A0A6A7AC07_9PLEO|nr:hypothetical protein CC86DRAFT_367382 [Ophiobolus disseminans]